MPNVIGGNAQVSIRPEDMTTMGNTWPRPLLDGGPSVLGGTVQSVPYTHQGKFNQLMVNYNSKRLSAALTAHASHREGIYVK